MKRVAVLIYGAASYAMFLGVFLYAIGFLGNFAVPKSIDSAREGSLGVALVVNVLLLGVFGVQHSVMARPAFKRWLTRFVPQPAERSTYVLFSNLALALLFWQWRPMGGVVWDVENPAGRVLLYGLFAFGWLTVLVTTFLINHFDLFGLRQVWLHFRGRPYTPLAFTTPGPYKLVRHPLYVGWLTAFWATPTMTAAHLVFALGATAYILVAIWFEERDLAAAHGPAYAEYRKRVPMLIPRLTARPAAEPAEMTLR
ncbi:MAG TPA: isoprenylcysteine carboxylmethyltransferase family protein [Gemmataceae bacterium]